jgi:hypothetical protein
MPPKPPTPPIVFSVRAPASHVQAAVAQCVQPKMPQRPGPLSQTPRAPQPPPPVRPVSRQPSPQPPRPAVAPVKPASPVQAKRPAPPVQAVQARRPAPHVQAAVATVQRKAAPPPPAARPAAPHVLAARQPVQAKAAAAPPVRRSPAPHVRSAAVQCARAGVIQRSHVDFSGVDARNSFRYLGSTESSPYETLALDVKQELYKNSSLNLSEKAKFSSKTESSYLALLEQNRPLHLGSNPDLGNPWQSIVKGYGGSKTGAALYATIRSPGYSAALKKLGIDPVTALKLAGGSKKAKAPEVHHLIYKKEEPQSAVLLWNLMLATRGSSDGPKGLHELLHGASSPKGRPNISQSVYLNEVPAVKGLIRQWAQGPRPTVSVPNSLYTPSYDIFQDLHGFSPLGLPTLSYSQPFVFDELPLSFLEQDNSFFSRQSDLNQSFLQWQWVDDEHDHWDELDRLLELDNVVEEYGGGFDSYGGGFGSFGGGFDSYGGGFGSTSSSSFFTSTFNFPTYTPTPRNQLPSLFPELDDVEMGDY